MKLALVGVAFGGVVGLVLLSSLAGDKVRARGVGDGSRASALKSPTTSKGVRSL